MPTSTVRVASLTLAVALALSAVAPPALAEPPTTQPAANEAEAALEAWVTAPIDPDLTQTAIAIWETKVAATDPRGVRNNDGDLLWGGSFKDLLRLAFLRAHYANEPSEAITDLLPVLTFDSEAQAIAARMAPAIVEMSLDDENESIARRNLVLGKGIFGDVPLDVTRPLHIHELQGLATSWPASAKAFLDDASEAQPSAALHDALADLHRLMGDRDASEANAAALHAVRHFAVIGPFKNERNSGFDQVFPPETEIDFAATYPGRQTDVQWRPLPTALLPADGQLDLSDLFYPADQSLAYFLTYVHSPTERNAVVRLGAEDSVKAWFNDRLAFTTDRETRYRLDQHATPVVLREGWNKLLLKVGRRDRAWRLCVRITDPDSLPMPDLKYATSPADIDGETPDESQAAAPTFAYVKPVVEALAELRERFPNSTLRQFEHAEALVFAGRQEDAVLAMEQLVARVPTSAIFRLNLALMYLRDDKPEKALDEINAALEADPDNVAAGYLLGQFYLLRGLNDQALRHARELHADHADKRPIVRLLRDAYERKGFDEHAFRLTKQLAEMEPTNRDDVAKYAAELQQRDHRDDARATIDALATQVPGDNMVNALARARLQEAHADASLTEWNADAIAWSPADLGPRLRQVGHLMGLRDYKAAEAELNAIAQLNPQHPRVAQLRGQIAMRQGDDEAALQHWQTALALDPDNGRLRDYVEFLAPTQNPVFARFGITDSEADAILAAEIDRADYPKADAVVMLDHTVTELFDDASTSTLEHQIIAVFNERARDRYKTVSLSGRNPKVLRARVLQPDGTEVPATEIRGNQIHFARLVPGSRIEVKTEYHSGGGTWLSRHWTHINAFQGGEPRLRSEYVLIHPTSRIVKTELVGEEFGSGIDRDDSTFEGKRVMHFTARDVPVVEAEANRPAALDIIQHVRFSTIEDWDEIAAWEWSLIRDQFKADEAVKAKVAELIAGAETREQRLKAIADFVMHEVQYKQDYTQPILGMKPHSASQVLSKLRGDCKDKAALMITMLAEAGIEAEYVTLRTRGNGELVTSLPSNQCNHAIVYVPGENGEPGMYIDGTATWLPHTTLPLGDQSVTAIHLSDGNYRFERTPTDPPQANTQRIAVQADLTAEGDGTGMVQYVFTGNFAPVLRNALQRPDVFRRNVEAVLNQLYPGTSLKDWQHSDPNDRYADQYFAAQAEMPAMLQAGSDGQLVVRLPEQMKNNLTRSFAPEASRTYDVFLQATMRKQFVQEYRLPAGMEIASLPQEADVQTPWMAYQRSVQQDGETLRVVSTFDIAEPLIPQANYGELRAFCLEVDRLEQQDIVLKPTSAAGE